jgi:hypothetical protein
VSGLCETLSSLCHGSLPNLFAHAESSKKWSCESVQRLERLQAIALE